MIYKPTFAKLQKSFFKIRIKMKLNLTLSLIAVLAILSMGCSSELSFEERKSKDISTIQNYLMDNGLEADTVLDNGLHAIIDNPSSGGHPTAASLVTVVYKGYFTDGEVFDQSDSDGIKFPLTGVIPGWTIGIPLYKKNGKGTLLLPSHLAYGEFPPPGIPKNAVMLFDVELLDF